MTRFNLGTQIYREGHGRWYRVHKNVKWGHFYNAQTETHDCVANDPDAASQLLRPDRGDGFQTMQVRTAQGWQFVTEVPAHLGGIWNGR